jgi:hypothetical protein
MLPGLLFSPQPDKGTQTMPKRYPSMLPSGIRKPSRRQAAPGKTIHMLIKDKLSLRELSALTAFCGYSDEALKVESSD